ncbi:MAG: phosphatase PAP2 family protein [Nitrospiraceae bacterium]|nr:phosphatase PAP2 family protein [Nitrospiraceae bacterium]
MPVLSAIAFSALAAFGSFLVLLQIDIPLLRFLRALNLSSVQRLGDWGEKLGNGGTLVGISLAIFALGWFLKRERWQRVALDSLLAHGAVALVVNGLKHLIGRPRPRLTHGDDWQWWPSWESGMDSLPSGHTSATVAVVTVLVRGLPRARWLPFVIAAWVAASRIWRGSHFPSDVAAGMVVGYMTGTVFNAPLKWWYRSAALGLVRIAPVAVAVAGLFWIVSHRVIDPGTDMLLVGSGLLLVVAGASIGMLGRRNEGSHRSGLAARVPLVCLGLGLGVATGAPVIMVLSLLVCLAWLLEGNQPTEETVQAVAAWPQPALYAMGGTAALLVIYLVKGLIPLR